MVKIPPLQMMFYNVEIAADSAIPQRKVSIGGWCSGRACCMKMPPWPLTIHRATRNLN